MNGYELGEISPEYVRAVRAQNSFQMVCLPWYELNNTSWNPGKPRQNFKTRNVFDWPKEPNIRGTANLYDYPLMDEVGSWVNPLYLP